MNNSLFITFEGIDGAGKSTHVTALAEAFQAQGRIVTLTREPGGTPLAEKLRALALNDAMDTMTEALLMFAARRDHLVQMIEPALARGEVVLCDRFTDSTFAYQGGGREFDWDLLNQLERVALTQTAQAVRDHEIQDSPIGSIDTDSTSHASAKPLGLIGLLGISELPLRQPDLTLWFDLPPELASVRLAQAREPDKFEAQSTSFFHRVAAAYERRSMEFPRRFVRINADQPKPLVCHQVLQAVAQRGWLGAHTTESLATKV